MPSISQNLQSGLKASRLRPQDDNMQKQFLKRICTQAENLLIARHLQFTKVPAARKTNQLITASARKIKPRQRMLANARRGHSIPLNNPNDKKKKIKRWLKVGSAAKKSTWYNIEVNMYI